VLARMKAMEDLRQDLAILGDMAKGKAAFDAATARAAARSLSHEAARIVPLFATPAQDPKSEALPVIWERFEDFSEKAQASVDAASTAAERLTKAQSLRPALARIGKTCRNCHESYRKPGD
ncbi:cytochrome c, partial [Cribrihabitans sp. XS_ASV171]